MRPSSATVDGTLIFPEAMSALALATALFTSWGTIASCWWKGAMSMAPSARPKTRFCPPLSVPAHELLDEDVGRGGRALERRGEDVVGGRGVLVDVGAYGEEFALAGGVDDAHSGEAGDLEDDVGALVGEGEGGFLALGPVGEGAA